MPAYLAASAQALHWQEQANQPRLDEVMAELVDLEDDALVAWSAEGPCFVGRSLQLHRRLEHGLVGIDVVPQTAVSTSLARGPP